MLRKGCVGGGRLDEQYEAINTSPAISSKLHSGPYGIYCIIKDVNIENISNDH